MNRARYASTATVLSNGSVLVTGGAQEPNAGADWTNAQLLSSCEIYNNGTWYTTGSLHIARADHEVRPPHLPHHFGLRSGYGVCSARKFCEAAMDAGNAVVGWHGTGCWRGGGGYAVVS